jgi:mRNA interferase HigB
VFVGCHAIYPPLKQENKHFPFRELFTIFGKRISLRIIAKKVLREFWQKHTDCEQQLKAWFQETSKAEWEIPRDIKKDYPTASFLVDNRIVFNIKGNHYRLIVRINYDYQMVWIRFIGTHAEYDKIDATKI